MECEKGYKNEFDLISVMNLTTHNPVNPDPNNVQVVFTDF